MAKEKITDFYGNILGYVETKPNGDKTVTDFYGKILGYYDKKLNITTDFYRKKLANGDMAVGLIWSNKK